MTSTKEPILPLSVRQVIQAVQDGVVVTDLAGAILAVNRVFCAVTGYTRREVLGRNPRILHSGRQNKDYYSNMWSALLKNGTWQGEIWNRRKNGEVYPEWLTISAVRDARGRARCYLGVFRDITNPKLDEERLRRLAQHDPLTGLPNRRLFNERLQRALARRLPRRRPCVLFLDLDRFKTINDRWGHAAGDALLQAAAARLRACVRKTDTAARWAGDEFAVLINPISGRKAAARIAENIRRVLRRPFNLRGRRVQSSACIGVCLHDGKSSSDELVLRADQAMYAAKERGRDGVLFWTRAVSLRLTSATPQRGASAKAAQWGRKTPQAQTGRGP